MIDFKAIGFHSFLYDMKICKQTVQSFIGNIKSALILVKMTLLLLPYPRPYFGTMAYLLKQTEYSLSLKHTFLEF